MEELIKIIHQFQVKGRVISVKPLGQGFINNTYKVWCEGSEDPAYLLQKKNKNVFPDIPGMMQNTKLVTDYIRPKVADPAREVLNVVPATDGKLYFLDESGEYWAMCDFITGTSSYEVADSPLLAKKGGEGLGIFHLLADGFDGPLVETIKGFHNIKFRFAQWDTALKTDAARRVGDVLGDIRQIEDRRQKMLAYWRALEDEVPTRVTHNDTKISNFLFDEKTSEPLCAIDLDTLMRKPLHYDVGDALRSYTNTGAEDDKDLRNVSMSMDMFKAYMEGYLSKMAPALTPKEKEHLAFSGIYITYEQVLRFLMDYINGDTYYKTAYKEHNLVRARAQLRLLESMEAQYGDMKSFLDA